MNYTFATNPFLNVPLASLTLVVRNLPTVGVEAHRGGQNRAKEGCPEIILQTVRLAKNGCPRGWEKKVNFQYSLPKLHMAVDRNVYGGIIHQLKTLALVTTEVGEKTVINVKVMVVVMGFTKAVYRDYIEGRPGDGTGITQVDKRRETQVAMFYLHRQISVELAFRFIRVSRLIVRTVDINWEKAIHTWEFLWCICHPVSK